MLIRKGQATSLDVLGTRVQFLCESESTAGAWSLMETQLPKGSGPPPHQHDWDEAYYVLAGEVVFTLGSETLAVSAGDFVYSPRNVVHGFKGVSEEPARLLIFDAPSHAGSFFKEVDRQVKSLPDDLPKLRGIGERHGVRFKVPGGK